MSDRITSFAFKTSTETIFVAFKSHNMGLLFCKKRALGHFVSQNKEKKIYCGLFEVIEAKIERSKKGLEQKIVTQNKFACR